MQSESGPYPDQVVLRRDAVGSGQRRNAIAVPIETRRLTENVMDLRGDEVTQRLAVTGHKRIEVPDVAGVRLPPPQYR